MWTTYPARPIDGVMVSDYLPYGASREKPLANLVYPDSLTEAVVAHRVLGPERAPVVTAVSPSFAAAERDDCRRLAESWSLRWSEVHTDVMKTQALRQALERHGFDAAIGGDLEHRGRGRGERGALAHAHRALERALLLDDSVLDPSGRRSLRG